MSEQAKCYGISGVTRVGILAMVALAMGACGNLRQQMGLDKQTPDEFRIVARPPLSLPPDYALRPPQPGAARPQEATVVDRAKQTVFRIEPSAAAPTRELPAGASAGESVLLRQAGADRADPNIREVLTKEGVGAEQPERGVVERLAFWRSAPEAGVVVDPQREAQRLRENQALGRPVTEGETAVIRRRRRGLFEGIL
ncbi:beta-barrel assembly complex subunit BamF [Stella humosa]|uniref:Beta-barrel assembly complex subunit BamF n=1 Tax=Stella humosa TaxID=94 RepID=A0A3N1LP69_9PROT|nr:DUF3035 domain-containing protein [Stella humosa]ROP91015.1 beta-barrel assembly complex subunit BamF [Stella humosa]BBK34635.1 hypothetical protein STHU_52690 [Stella humosa]